FPPGTRSDSAGQKFSAALLLHSGRTRIPGQTGPPVLHGPPLSFLPWACGRPAFGRFLSRPLWWREAAPLRQFFPFSAGRGPPVSPAAGKYYIPPAPPPAEVPPRRAAST